MKQKIRYQTNNRNISTKYAIFAKVNNIIVKKKKINTTNFGKKKAKSAYSEKIFKKFI